MPLNKHFQNILSLSFKYNANANMLRYLSKFLNRKVTFVDRLLKIIEVMFVIFGICITLLILSLIVIYGVTVHVYITQS